MDIWEKCNSYVQLKNEKWMYGEKVMENVENDRDNREGAMA